MTTTADVRLGMPALPAPTTRPRCAPGSRRTRARSSPATRTARSALLPLLHLVQSEEGYVTAHRHRASARSMLDLTTAEVTAVATFYTMYRRKPTGDYQVGVCTNTLCAVMGGDAIFDELKEHLGVGNNETTEDGKVTLEHIECNAACDFAPVVMVNWEFFDNQTPESAPSSLVDDLRAGRTVAPTRGAPLCTFKETARILAGFPDERPGAVEATGGAGPASLVGLRLAKGEAPRARAPRGGAPTSRGPPTSRPPSTSARTTRRRRRRPPTRPPAGPAAEEGSDDLGTRAEGTQPREAARTRAVGLLGRARVLDAGRPTGGTRGTRACARRSPWPRTTSSRTSRTPVCAAAAAPASPPG